MKSDNYVVIQGWMCNELELKGNDLLVFALIHGFSQDGQSKFMGSRRYIAETFNISLPTVDKTLKKLVDNSLIEQEVTEINGVVFNAYKTLPGVKKLYREGKETLPNKASKQTNRNLENNNSKELLLENPTTFLGSAKKQTKQSLYAKCLADIDSRNYPKELHDVLVDYLQLRLQMRDKPLYANSWKGLLNKLEREFKERERVRVVLQSIERGYASFFPVSATKKQGKPWEIGVVSENYTEEEMEDLKKWQDEMRKKGLRVDF